MAKKGFIEIDAGVAVAILIATLFLTAALLLQATSALGEKAATFKQMEKALQGRGGANCVATVSFEGSELRRVCSDPLA